ATSGDTVTFRERIATDGDGRYSVEPLEALDSSIRDWDGFELLQRAEEGFIFRYRDFVVRQPELFQRNYRTTDLHETTAVAGRTCARYRVERVVGTTVRFELSIERATQLVLASQEFDSNGRLVAAMNYEAVDLQPDL